MSDGVILLPPESERYRAELIFVHGLWVDSRIWRGIAAGFAHRGWSCVLVDRVSSSGDSDDSSWVGRVAHVAARREVLPIVIGHDAGALVALDLAARGAVRAAVAIAPLLEGASPLQSPSARLVRRLRGDRAAIAPPDPTHAFFAGIPDERRAEIAGALGPEKLAALREVDRLATPARPSVPTLLVAPQDDRLATPVATEICARGIEADYLRIRGGHWPMLEPRADEWITQIHRWLIKAAAQDLLLLRGDEDLVE